MIGETLKELSETIRDSYLTRLTSLADTRFARRRMGGYGRILNVFSSQDPPHKEVLSKFNFDYKRLDVLKFVSAYEVFGEGAGREVKDLDACDDEKQKLKGQGWPVPLMEHTKEVRM